jgi:hypothetical protein
VSTHRCWIALLRSSARHQRAVGRGFGRKRPTALTITITRGQSQWLQRQRNTSERSGSTNGTNTQSNWRTSQRRQAPRAHQNKCQFYWGTDCVLLKVDEVHNCESDYHCQQAETEDVADIVPGYPRTSAFSILLVGTATPISLFIFRRYWSGMKSCSRRRVPQTRGGAFETVYLAASDAFQTTKMAVLRF